MKVRHVEIWPTPDSDTFTPERPYPHMATAFIWWRPWWGVGIINRCRMYGRIEGHWYSKKDKNVRARDGIADALNRAYIERIDNG